MSSLGRVRTQGNNEHVFPWHRRHDAANPSPSEIVLVVVELSSSRQPSNLGAIDNDFITSEERTAASPDKRNKTKIEQYERPISGRRGACPLQPCGVSHDSRSTAQSALFELVWR